MIYYSLLVVNIFIETKVLPITLLNWKNHTNMTTTRTVTSNQQALIIEDSLLSRKLFIIGCFGLPFFWLCNICYFTNVRTKYGEYFDHLKEIEKCTTPINF